MTEGGVYGVLVHVADQDAGGGFGGVEEVHALDVAFFEGTSEGGAEDVRVEAGEILVYCVELGSGIVSDFEGDGVGAHSLLWC